jgi:uncharacterized membrane protein (DUF2068 family)
VIAPPSPPVPGTHPRKRFRLKFDWELIDCGVHGHVLIGTDAAEIRSEDAPIARVAGDERLHRCLRCDVWVPVEPPSQPASQFPPPLDQVTMPLKGRRLRDRYVLRLIVLDRALHVLVLGALAAAIFLFAGDKHALHRDFTKVLQALQAGFGGPIGNQHSGIVHDIDRLFALSTREVYLIGGVVTLYAALLAIEAIGLWGARRWAEYLTFVETGSLVPFEIYELTGTVSALKILTLVINLAVVLYLLIAHRLFGLRGGKAAAMAAYGAEG